MGAFDPSIRSPSLVLLCYVVLKMSTIINQPPPLHQYSLLWVATPSATFHEKFLDQRLNWFRIGQIPHPCPWGGTWGNTLMGALWLGSMCSCSSLLQFPQPPLLPHLWRALRGGRGYRWAEIVLNGIADESNGYCDGQHYLRKVSPGKS